MFMVFQTYMLTYDAPKYQFIALRCMGHYFQVMAIFVNYVRSFSGMVTALSNNDVGRRTTVNQLKHGCYCLHCTMQEEITPLFYTSPHGHCRLYLIIIIGFEV